jgi:uncharacterized membrane protein (UPF0136 family)
MISIAAPLFLLGGVLGYWVVRKKGFPVRLISGAVSGCVFVGIFLVAVILGGDH